MQIANRPAGVSEAVEILCDAGYFWSKKKICVLLRDLAKHSAATCLPLERTPHAISTRLGLKTRDSVPVQIMRLKGYLEEFFAGEGAGLPFRIQIGGGGRHQIHQETNYLIEVSYTMSDACVALWSAHADSGDDVLIASNAPLFYRFPAEGRPDYRIRMPQVNDAHAEIADEAIREKLKDCAPCNHYISIGDYKISTELLSFFHGVLRKRATCYVATSEWKKSERRKLPASADSNVVIFGNPRVSWIFRDWQREIKPEFFVPEGSAESLSIRNRLEQEMPPYKDRPEPGGRIYAALVRRSGPDGIVTLVGVQNGPALEALAGVLTDDVELRRCIGGVVKEKDLQQFPASFELLFEIPIGPEESVGTPVLVTSRPWGWNGDYPKGNVD